MTNFFNCLILLINLISTGRALEKSTTNGSIDNCSPLSNLDTLTQEQFVSKLTESCRYDKLIKPITRKPLPVYVQIDISHVESSDQAQFLAHMMVQYKYNDKRLKYDEISPKRGVIMGEQPLRDKVWVPHMIIRNEKEANIMGIDGKDVFVMITPKGDVIYSSRMIAKFYCWMELRKFPFDTQDCYLKWNSWTYNTSNLILRWDEDLPAKISDNLDFTEFLLLDKWAEETLVPASFTSGALVGNFSELVFKFRLTREMGYYIMDYFLPSILLVCTSWVTFWLQADAAPPRTVLGTSTILTLITLHGSLIKNLPKVSYVKASDVWFLACFFFIFGSLAEFAFVNVIWRRKKTVELKKQSGKHIIKGAFTPSLARKQLRKETESIYNLYKPKSCPTINEKTADSYLTIHGLSGTPSPLTRSQDSLVKVNGSTVTIHIPEAAPRTPTWHSMTPEEVAIWIDRKARIIFPLAFLIFNVFYWSLLYIL